MAGILKVDDLRGNTSAGDITITSEGGSATMQLQQGVAKAWCRYNATGTPAADDSFNVASLTDTATGNIKCNFSNNMNNANHSSPAISNSMNTVSQGAATSNVETITYSSSHSASDAARNMVTTFGDLA